jgi:hypothetical protein
MKQLDVDRLKDMCQPRIRIDKRKQEIEEKEAEKKKPKRDATD